MRNIGKLYFLPPNHKNNKIHQGLKVLVDFCELEIWWHFLSKDSQIKSLKLKALFIKEGEQNRKILFG